MTSFQSAMNALVLPKIRIPEPVFFCCLEPEGDKDLEKIMKSLDIITKDDPSVVVEIDENEQLLLKGMGELHLEIVLERLKRDFKCNVETGPIQISYRESVLADATGVKHFEGLMNGLPAEALVAVEIEPIADLSEGQESGDLTGGSSNTIVWDCDVNAAQIHHSSIMEAVESGIEMGLQRGPIQGYSVINTQITIKRVAMGDIHDSASSFEGEDGDVNPSAFQLAASQALQTALGSPEASARLCEPIMACQLSVPTEYIGNIMTDLTTKRRATVQNMESGNDTGGNVLSKVQCHVPLAEVVGYSTTVRSLSQGTANLHLSFSHYDAVPTTKQKELTGGRF
jgi:elongation factor G